MIESDHDAGSKERSVFLELRSFRAHNYQIIHTHSE
jgi:hypothetical protein